VLTNLAIESITVDTKNLSGSGLISTRFGKCRLNESFFKLAQSFIQEDAPFDHFRNKGFQLLFHNFFLELGGVLFCDFVILSVFPPPTLQRAIADEKFRLYFVRSRYRYHS
jgi:hypothetical protein